MKQILLFIISIPLFALGQDCDCESNFKWVKETFEDNDAGFQYIIDTKGSQSYELHNQILFEKIKITNDISECHSLLNEW